MAFAFQDNGCLIPGIHPISWSDFARSFGYTVHRMQLLTGLKLGIDQLRKHGCTNIYVDGSFVTKKWIPNDFDACWDLSGVNLAALEKEYPLFFDFDDSRKNQKEVYGGEFFPANCAAVLNPPLSYLQFFQLDRDGNPKGIVHIF